MPARIELAEPRQNAFHACRPREGRQACGSFVLAIGRPIRLQFAVATKLKNPEVHMYQVDANPQQIDRLATRQPSSGLVKRTVRVLFARYNWAAHGPRRVASLAARLRTIRPNSRTLMKRNTVLL
jgi:hypothetical protein